MTDWIAAFISSCLADMGKMYFNRIDIGNKIRKPCHRLKSKARAMLRKVLPALWLLREVLISYALTR